VLEAAEEQLESAAGSASNAGQAAPAEAFPREQLKVFFAKNVEKLKKASERQAGKHPELAARFVATAKSLATNAELLDSPGMVDLEDLERRLTILDEKLHAVLISHAAEELMLKIKREVDGQLALYRRKMKAEQLALVEKQYTHKRLLEEFELPRLSLFYLS
jgi:hypothetical protein